MLPEYLGSKLLRVSTAEGEIQELTDGYLEVYGFPKSIGVIDGIHIGIPAPSEHYSNFINRKVYFSLNVQVVCDYKYYLQDIV